MRISSRRQNNSVTRRIAPLAVLPVFLDLADKQVLIVGGSDAAAWKAELVLSAGAIVTVLARSEDLCAHMHGLLNDAEFSERAHHLNAHWQALDWPDVKLVIADVEEAHAEKVVAKARQRGAPCNVIDQPQYCDFQFGSIVNRSPVVVGISTHGAAPILGQAVRRRIEALLPKSLTEWAAAAQAVRANVMHRLAPGYQRRQFWTWFSERAFAPKSRPDFLQIEKALHIAGETAPHKGKVTIITVNNPRADLLTLKAVGALNSADTLMFDDDIGFDVLELARREAHRVRTADLGLDTTMQSATLVEKIARAMPGNQHLVWLLSAPQSAQIDFPGLVTCFQEAGIEVDAELAGIASSDHKRPTVPSVANIDLAAVH